MLGNTGKAAAASVVLSSLSQDLLVSAAIAADPADLNSVAGPDRVTVLPGKTYLMGWAGFGDAAQTGRDPAPPGPPPSTLEFRMLKGANPRSRTFLLSQAESAESNAPWLSVILMRGWDDQGRRILIAAVDDARPSTTNG